MLKIADAAPDFTLADANGNMVSLKDFRGKKTVLYFYPKDNTPAVRVRRVLLRKTMKNSKTVILR